MSLRRRAALLAGAILVLLLLFAIAARLLLQPDRLTGFALDALGNVLGLEITAEGHGEYRLRGTPTLVVRGVSARQPGAARPLMRAERVLLSLPWSTIRARGAELVLDRIELDAPVLDVVALQAWLASRPAGDGRLPTLRKGLAVVRGQVDGGGWRVEQFYLDLPSLRADRRVAANVRGRYVAAPTTVAFDLALAMTRPANGAGTAAAGTAILDRGDWRLPALLEVSGPVRFDDGVLRVSPLRLGASARYVAGDTDLPFSVGAYGPLRLREGTWTLVPAGLALRGQGLVPDLDAHGTLALGERLVLDFDGVLPRWPEAWPALPPPIGVSRSRLPFSLGYAGDAALGDPLRLGLRRDGARADVVFRIAEVAEWAAAAASGTPLPPLSGRASAPRMELAGAVLEGVEVEMTDDDAGPAAPAALVETP